jgi:hypothetical protein
MTGESISTALTPDEAWERLIGEWTYTFTATNSVSVMRLHFTPDRKLIRSNSLSGGVLPMPMTNESTVDVTHVAVKRDAIVLTLGRNAFGRAGGVLTLRFLAANQVATEEGLTYTREG